jgi:poly-gamma-glutamate system protein
MFKPSLKSTWTLFVLAVVAYGLYNWAEYSHVEHRQPNYESKLNAALRMERWLGLLREAQAPDAAFVDEINDPDRTLLVGQKHSLITSTEGNHQAKVATINPNIAAMMVQMLREAGVEPGDRVAGALTGSFPGLNLAFYAACVELQLKPVLITSVSSSWYGANDPDFTWLDMESVLVKAGEIAFRSVAASIGGADDRGRGLPPEGRDLLRKAIERTGVEFLHAPDVERAVAERLRIYNRELGTAVGGYAAYINIGGGVASLGHPESAQLMPLGVFRHLPPANWPGRGVIHAFSDEGVPMVNFKYSTRRFSSLLRDYGLPWRFSRIPVAGEGRIFVTERYDLRIVGLAVLLMAISVIAVIRFDLRLQKLGGQGMDPDEIV